ncbi:hypothetical protein DWB58_25740 [candidate division KSB1 bacterium]|nr:hypothetical protein [candidate division KSB1 bacterium]MDL1879044.1 hypothetical protein [Cytophagia bacterium CHB2]
MHRNEVAVLRESLPPDEAIDICVNCPMKIFISKRAMTDVKHKIREGDALIMFVEDEKIAALERM